MCYNTQNQPGNKDKPSAWHKGEHAAPRAMTSTWSRNGRKTICIFLKVCIAPSGYSKIRCMPARAPVEGTGSAPKQLRLMQTSSVWSRVIETLCLASNGVLYAQNGERANFTSFPGAPHATITRYEARDRALGTPTAKGLCMLGKTYSCCWSPTMHRTPTTRTRRA
jgi:hypothetical protein